MPESNQVIVEQTTPSESRQHECTGRPNSSRFWVKFAIFYAVPPLLIAAVWLNFLQQYYVPPTQITETIVQQSRHTPADSVLTELRDFRLVEPSWSDNKQTISVATQLLRGEWRFSGCPSPARPVFLPSDLELGTPTCQLQVASLAVPNILLQAFDLTGHNEFFKMATEYILQFEAYERGAILPRRMLWSDHAIAARVFVLANFWRIYRRSPGFDTAAGRRVLQMTARSQQLLAKPHLFTFNTNHGIMQNLALLHAAVAFPSLPHSREYADLAGTRLADQMKFFLSDEGVILEHSADYQFLGMKLLAFAFRYRDLLQERVPAGWIQKYNHAEQFYASLRRPDGTLPMFGDTDSRPDPDALPITSFDAEGYSRPLVFDFPWKPDSANALYPVSGYSVWWTGLESWPDSHLGQLVAAWSNFPGRGHKHDDDMSVLFWGAGTNWWSNVGYWPYGVPGRDDAVSWSGSNAPHLANESFSAGQTTTLLANRSSNSINVLDLQRTGAQGYVARREIIQLQPHFWIVLDSASGPEHTNTTTVWTTAPEVQWLQRPNGSFVLQSSRSPEHLEAFIAGSPAPIQRHYRGSFHPFAGWQVVNAVPTPASAMIVEQHLPHSWAATFWSLDNPGQNFWAAALPHVTYWRSPADWEISVTTDHDIVRLHRQGGTIEQHSNIGDSTAITLKPPLNTKAAITQLEKSFALAESRYPLYNLSLSRRLRVTYALLFAFLLEQLLFWTIKRIRSGYLGPFIYVSTGAWIIGGLGVLYFCAWM